MKETVTERARRESVLKVQEFDRICEESAGGGQAITDEDEKRALLRLLNDLGVVVAYGLRKGEPVALRQISLLDPNWLTGAIYAILNSPELRDQQAEFERRDLDRWLAPDLYPSGDRVALEGTSVSCADVAALEAKGVEVTSDCG